MNNETGGTFTYEEETITAPILNDYIELNGSIYRKNRIVEVTPIINADDGTEDPFFFRVRLDDRSSITMAYSTADAARDIRNTIRNYLGVDVVN